jgi:hypothetical protein
MAEKVGARTGDVLVFGHTHKPWTRVLDGIQFVNAGSAGRPKDGDWRACYLLLHLEDDGAGKGRVRAEYVRVEYDLPRTQEGIRAAGLPEEFAEALETGGVNKKA